jgi:hypothetical protein
MPSLAEAINADRSNLTPVGPMEQEQKPAPVDPRLASLLKNPTARCPLPSSNNSADSLRQWGQGTEVPKFRTQTPPSNIMGSGGGTTVKATSVSSSSSSSSTTTVGVLPKLTNVSVTTSVLAPSQTWTGSLQMAKAFIVVNVSGSAFCRVELYGTKIGQTLDLSRPVTQGPNSTTIGLIMDVALLTAKSWQVLDCVGSNGDSTQSSTIYITVTNLSTGSGKITVSIQYVPEES